MTETQVSDTTDFSAAPVRVGARERILDAARELFPALGYRAVSADRIIATAGITKVTFYRHFPTKDDLIVAYLDSESARARDSVARLFLAAEPGEGPVRILTAEQAELFLCGFARVIGIESCRPGFRGCVFLNAAAEYAEPEHPIRRAVLTHRDWLLGTLADAVSALGIAPAEPIARQLLMLRDGAMFAGYLDTPEAIEQQLHTAGRAILRAAA
ncbi:TetR/AcrR family transcriptional regulator [Mycetocola tolaasinivorans]|uniref:TetR/AcrR family transcriptional regulator n=1 Tax=Mycetocola tolaasinivorans TaxID=76635 RepID=A0A3L7A733_9MICO|nr:TetR/AcrR family transcriptional regulator [Mycetocola tolaasinivorans]RLP75934.1 TetR/AcrR family transcriptional regulator [Mycetocola tolaasinivorans]